MSKHLKTILIGLASMAVLLGGCQSRPSSTAMPAAAQEAANLSTPTATATRAIVATAPPTATNTRVVPATATLGATVTSTPSVTPEPTATQTPTTTPVPAATQTPVPPAAVAESGYQEGFTDRGQPFKGDLAAPVVMEEFSSYQCGFCARYFRESFDQVMENYVESGQVLYIYRDFPLPSQRQSALAAEAANCAGETGDGSTYWEMHDLLFGRQAEWSGRGDADAIFKGYAQELGLDGATFDQCLDSGATRNLVEVDLAAGYAEGVRGTPTFLIDGQQVIGAQPYSVIAAAIDAAIAKALAESSEEGIALQLAPASALAPDLRQLPQYVQEAYRFALANPDALEVMPCYCGCNGVGHKNNRMCYVEAELADGQVVFDYHAVT